MKNIRLFLDDIRSANMAHSSSKGLGSAYSKDSDWTIARTYDDFVDAVNANFDDIDLISFDHDLACFDAEGNEMTGKTAVDYVIGYCLDNDKPFPKSWYVHSDNTSGRQNIIGAITNYLDKVEGIRYPGFSAYHKGVLNGKPV
jgi:hypothetical protein